MASSPYIDWNFAVHTARRFVRPGPDVTAAEAAEAVAELRRGAELSEGPVRDFTGLHARSATAPVVVVDRPGWVQANADGFATVMAPLLDKVSHGRPPPSAGVQLIGSRVTGAEAGALLAYLSHKVLGQFDPFWDGPVGSTGRMLLVAPNIVAVEGELGVDPHDFRLWVCLHEETHRVQFTAVPWLRDHVRSLISQFVDSTDLDPDNLGRLLTDGMGRLSRVLRGDPDVSIIDVFTNDRQRAVIGQVTGVMSLLEGHADVVMDGVGPQVVPSVEQIRKRFERRRDGASPVDVLLRRLMGLDVKLRQYRDGATFVRHAVATVGMDGFNRVWESPQQLPSAQEILDPAAWVRRVHG